MATEARAQRRLRRAFGGALGVLLAAALLAPAGCSWNRRVLNEELRRLDFDSIQPGRTTLGEVVMEFGLPPEDDPEEIGTRILNGDQIYYATLDQRCTVLGLVYIFTLTPFRWCAAVRTYEVSVEFDAQGVVERVVSTRREGYWPPFWNHSDATPPVTRIRTAEGRR